MKAGLFCAIVVPCRRTLSALRWQMFTVSCTLSEGGCSSYPSCSSVRPNCLVVTDNPDPDVVSCIICSRLVGMLPSPSHHSWLWCCQTWLLWTPGPHSSLAQVLVSRPTTALCIITDYVKQFRPRLLWVAYPYTLLRPTYWQLLSVGPSNTSSTTTS